MVLSVDDDCPIAMPDFRSLATISDNCSDVNKLTVTQSPVAGTMISGHGTSILITISATDEYNNTATCTFTLSLQDTIAPMLTCPAKQTLLINDDCEAILPDYRTLATATNTCNSAYPITIQQIPAAGTIISGIGTIDTISIIATDSQGNADTCTFKVYLIFDLPPLIVRTNVKVGERMEICIDHPCLVGSDIQAYDKSGLGIGIGAGGDFEVNPLTGCLTYALKATPYTNQDSFNVVICDVNGYCDTVNYRLEIDAYQAFIVDPCVCLNNESSFKSGDGQFFEYAQITAPSGDNWQVIAANGFYVNPAGGIVQPNKGGTPYPLNPITKGTATIEVPRGNGLSDYYLVGLHIDDIGYAISFSNTKDTLHISNRCTYDASCRQVGIVGGEDGLPPEIPSCSIEIGNGTTPALTTLENCQPCQFRSNNIEHLYEDDSVRNIIHTICPTDKWKQLKINFSRFELAAGDTLYVYDGKTIVDSLLDKYSGTGVSQTGGWVASSCLPSLNSSGCLTFQFKTNGDNNKGTGWQSEATCVEKSIVLTPPSDLLATLTCPETYAVFDILPATITSNCGMIQDSQIVRVFNQHGVVCLDTCLAMTDVIKDTFAIGGYLVQYKLKSDTVKMTTSTLTVQARILVCNDEVNVPLGSACGLMLTPDDLLESTCDTIIDTLYYFIKLKGVDKNGNAIVLAEGGGKGGNYPIVSKDMIDQCGGSITAEIERRYYEGLNLSICNNGIKSINCTIKVNIFDQSPPIFQHTTTNDTFRLCRVDLTADALGIPIPTAIDNCDTVKVEFVGATVLNDGGTCDTTRALLNWTATDVCGNMATLAQSIVIVRPDMGDIVQAQDVVLSCGEDTEADLNDFAKTGMPRIKIGKVVNGILIPTDTIALDTVNYVCGYILQKRDIEVPSDCGVKVFRYWDILDWCDTENGIQPIDMQFIELRDTLAPKFSATVLPTLTLDLPHDACTLDVTKLTAPVATDNCATPIVSIDKVFRIENGEKWEIPMAELIAVNTDSFEVVWVVEDGCHAQSKTTSITQLVIIEDNTKPVAICTNKINLSLGRAAAKLHYREIDGGSNDVCGIAKYEVSRDEILWDSVVNFTCEDAHQETKVYLRVTDMKGNENTCWMIVNVEDKIAPICSDLPTMTGTCDEGHVGNGLAATDMNENGEMDDNEWIDLTEEQAGEMSAKYGSPNCSDNVTCHELVIQQQYQFIEKACGMAMIKRRFRAIDWDGQGMTSNWSEQRINIETKADWTITLPADWKGACGETVPNAELSIKNGACDLMGYEVEEKTFSPSGAEGENACLKVVRTFTIINWCKYEAGGETKTIARVENEHGMVTGDRTITSEDFENVSKLEYVQILKLKDETAPTITVNPVDDCISTNNCLAEKTFSITATDCNVQSTATLTYSWQLYQFQTEALIAEGTGASFNRTVSPTDRFVVKWEVADNCGNIGTATANHYFVDCQKPVPYCLNGIGVKLSESGKTQIWASDIDAGSYDNCTKEDLQIKIWHESWGEAPTHIASILALPENITFDCGYLGNQAVNLYVIDGANNWDYCTC